MNWDKKGLIYAPDGNSSWAKHTAMTPTPFLISDDVIRIYAGFRDDEGVSRIGYVDVNADNPKEILKISEKPVLDIGEPGCFDDNGVILGDVIKVDNKLYMYYIGFQLVKKVKFLAFTGLAISEDNGDTFQRYQKTPILDRTVKAPYIRAIHSVLYEDDIFKAWYPIDKGWQYIDGLPYPSYNIWYTESNDGIHFTKEDNILCIDTKGSEYRIGRPRVYKENDLYKMYYTRDFIERNYIAGYAESKDGKNWIRLDNKLGIEKSKEGWDSQMCCYPVLLSYKNKKYMFYNGNNYGKTGFGYAERIEE